MKHLPGSRPSKVNRLEMVNSLLQHSKQTERSKSVEAADGRHNIYLHTTAYTVNHEAIDILTGPMHSLQLWSTCRHDSIGRTHANDKQNSLLGDSTFIHHHDTQEQNTLLTLLSDV